MKFDESNIDALFNGYVEETVATLKSMLELENYLFDTAKDRRHSSKKSVMKCLASTRAAVDLMCDNWTSYLRTHFDDGYQEKE